MQESWEDESNQAGDAEGHCPHQAPQAPPDCADLGDDGA